MNRLRAAVDAMEEVVAADYWPVPTYDEILFYGLNPWLYGIGDYSNRLGKAVRWSRFDEGVLSYRTDFSMGKLDGIIEPLRRAVGKYAISDCVTKYYCSFPELKKDNQSYEIKRIPPINSLSVEVAEVLRHCFNYKGFPYSQKYIFFASSSDIDGEPFGETEMVLNLADKLGANNLLVKMHPRDTRMVYSQYGIEVMSDGGIPWEVIQLCEDMSDRVLLTATSGSFLTISAMSVCDALSLFLVPDEINSQALSQRVATIQETLDALHDSNHAMNVKLVPFREFLSSFNTPQEKSPVTGFSVDEKSMPLA